MNDSTCMVDTASILTDFSVDESCGKCVPLPRGMKVMLNILNRIVEVKGEMEDIEKLQRLGHHIKETSHCGLGKTAPNPVSPRFVIFDMNMKHIFETSNACSGLWDLIQFRVDEKSARCAASARRRARWRQSHGRKRHQRSLTWKSAFVSVLYPGM